jgi:TPP-dependent 2-oxoacid decarboxylase
MSVGGCIACSERPKGKVYCITGDGAFLMSAQELSVLIEHGLDYTIIILDNAGYGAERQIWSGKERSYNNFSPWNHELLPVAFGGTEGENAHGIVVNSEIELDAALKKSRTLKGVKLIRAMLDRWDTASFNVKMSEAMRH